MSNLLAGHTNQMQPLITEICSNDTHVQLTLSQPLQLILIAKTFKRS